MKCQSTITRHHEQDGLAIFLTTRPPHCMSTLHGRAIANANITCQGFTFLIRVVDLTKSTKCQFAIGVFTWSERQQSLFGHGNLK
jgi:hypothetical protein